MDDSTADSMADSRNWLRDGLRDLSDCAGDAAMEDRILRASRRLGRKRFAVGTALAVAVAALSVPVVTAAADRSGPARPAAPARPAGTPATDCPTPDTLLAALRDSPGFLGQQHVPRTASVHDVVCAGRYAVARADPADGDVRVLFGRRLPEEDWLPLQAGTADLCEGFVLDATVKSRLPGC